MSQTEVKELLVKMTADDSQLNEAFQSAGSTIANFASKAGVAIAATATAFAVFSARQAEVIGAADDMAKSLGLSYSSLQGMSLVAREAGVEMGQLGAAMGFMQRSIVEAASGNETAAASFDRLGLSANNLLALNPDEQFMAIANAISQIENPAERTAIAVEFFGRAGRNLLQMMDGYNEKMKDATDFTKTFGLSLDQIDVEKIGDAEDSVKRLGDAFRGLGQLLMVQIAPIITDISNQIIDATANAVNMFRKVNENAPRGIQGTPTGFDKTDFERMARDPAYLPDRSFSFPSGKKSSSGTGNGAQPSSTANTELKKSANEATEAQRELQRSIEEVNRQLDQTRNQVADTFSGFVQSVARGENAMQSFKNTAVNALQSVINEMFRLSFTGRTSGSGLFSSIASSLVGGFTGGFGGGSSIANPNIRGTSYMFADGGVVNGATVFPIGYNTGVMGEKGAEAIMPLTRGANGKLGVMAHGGGGGVNITQNLNFALGVSTEVQYEIRKMLPQIQEASVSAVEQAKARGVI